MGHFQSFDLCHMFKYSLLSDPENVRKLDAMHYLLQVHRQYPTSVHHRNRCSTR